MESMDELGGEGVEIEFEGTTGEVNEAVGTVVIASRRRNSIQKSAIVTGGFPSSLTSGLDYRGL